MWTTQQLQALSLADLASIAVSERLIERAVQKGLLFALYVEGVEIHLPEAEARIFLQRLIAEQRVIARQG